MTPRHPLGELLHDGDVVGLRYERHLAHPPERVWRAITESDQLQHWLPVDIVGDRREGAALSVPFWPDVADKHDITDSTLSGRILVWDPPRTFSWMWATDTLTFELHPVATGTRLVFTTWVVDTTAGVDRTAAGYHVCLDQLVTLVDTGSTSPFVEADPTPYETLYSQLITS